MFIIIRNDPYWNEDAWAVLFHPCNVLVMFQNICPPVNQNKYEEEFVKAYVDRLNSTLKDFVSYKSKRRFNVESLRRVPPYEEMVRIAGPKPQYDHSRENDKAYNDEHVIKVREWKSIFTKWSKTSRKEWLKRRIEIVDANLAEPDMSDHLLEGIQSKFLKDESYRRDEIIIPKFTYEFVPSRFIY